MRLGKRLGEGKCRMTPYQVTIEMVEGRCDKVSETLRGSCPMMDFQAFSREQTARDEALRLAFALLTDAIQSQTNEITLLREVITAALGEADDA
ncbi:MAG: hypothetical protein JWP29_1982 [Rhodoferax sp.]|nr:hypothetical protein [Rhodoferax sp.]